MSVVNFPPNMGTHFFISTQRAVLLRFYIRITPADLSNKNIQLSTLPQYSRMALTTKPWSKKVNKDKPWMSKPNKHGETPLPLRDQEKCRIMFGFLQGTSSVGTFAHEQASNCPLGSAWPSSHDWWVSVNTAGWARWWLGQEVISMIQYVVCVWLPAGQRCTSTSHETVGGCMQWESCPRSANTATGVGILRFRTRPDWEVTWVTRETASGDSMKVLTCKSSA